MRARIRRWTVLSCLLATFAAPATVLGAGPPANDDWANAPVISVIPYSDAEDATEASNTVDGFNYCGGGEHTVWYRVELPADAREEISTAGPFVVRSVEATISLFGFASESGEISEATVAKSITLKPNLD